MLLFFSAGNILAASEGGHASPAAEGQEAEGHGEEGAPAHAPGWRATDTYRVLNFAVLAGALIFLLRKPTAQALNNRIQGIAEQLKDLEAQKAEAEKQLAEYNRKFAQLEQEASSILADYQRQGEEAKARILKEAAEAAEKLKAQAQKSIQSEFEKARDDLKRDVLDQAMAQAEALIRTKITAGDQEKLVDEYLAKVVAS
jgi:F-type H+-transporting ATPase subunit b